MIRRAVESGDNRVLLQDGRYVCSWCGALLDIPLDAKTQSMLSAASGRPTVRVLRIDRVEIHRCEKPDRFDE